jgi:hypothetical protein
MKYVTVKDFGDALGVKGVTVRQRIGRGKLIKSENGLINVEDVTNYAYVVGINGGDLSVFEKYYKQVGNGTNVIKKYNKTSKNKEKVIIYESSTKSGNSTGVKTRQKSVEIAEKVENEKLSKIKGSVNIAPTVETQKLEPEKYAETAAERLEKKRAEKHRNTFQELELRKKEADVLFVERQSELKQIQLEKIAGNTLPLDITTNLLKINLQQIFKTFSIELENLATISVETLGGTRADLVRITNAQNAMLKKIVETAKVNANQEIEIYLQEYTETRGKGERKS